MRKQVRGRLKKHWVENNTYAVDNSNVPSVPDFGGARTTIPRFMNGGGGAFGALPKRTQRDLGLDERRFVSYSIEDLLDLLTDVHPDMSFALWNFMRIGSSNYTISVTKLGSGKPYPQAERDIQEFINRLSLPNMNQFEKSRAFSKVIGQLFWSVVIRGAAALELVLVPGATDVAFIAPVDPATVEFQFINDRFVPFQDNLRRSLDIPTFIYEGLDERIDDPYGRAPLLGALSMVLFQLQVLNDIKAVVHNQGYPRLDIKVLEEVLLARMPIAVRNNEEKKQEWLTKKLNEIIAMYSQLEPDDTFVHFDSIEVGMVGGKGNGGAMLDPQKLMEAIDNLIMSGLKTLSTILGRRSTGNTESFAKMEIKLYLQGVKAIQDLVASVLSRALMIFLNIRGKQGIVEFKFKPVEIRTELEQAQFQQIALQNYAFMRDQGWISQEEAAQMAVGHAPVGEPDWEHLGKSTVTNKDGSPTQGQKDEKGPNDPNN